MRGRILRSVLAASLLALALSPAPLLARAQTGLPAWGTVPSPNAGFANGNTLTAVAVLSGTDVWAAGSWEFSPFIHSQIQHWDGSLWMDVPLPPEVPESELFGIAAAAADDVWFVGGYESGGQALILHWDGSSLSLADYPNPGTFNRLFAATAISASDVWAVGEYINGGVSRTLTLHWDGAAWSQVRSPTRSGEYTQLNGVSGSASNDVWAVGQAGTRTFAIHWNGAQWQRVATPSPGTTAGFLAVSALASNDAWAVGKSSRGLLAAHWNGSQWVRVPTPNPNPGGFYRELHGVSAVAANDVWAVGVYSSGPTWFTLALHWDGASWQIVPSPSPDPTINLLNAVDSAGASEVWAVGRGGGTLVERWQGSVWTAIPSANSGTADNVLIGISAISAGDIWAVGEAGGQSLAEHWDGALWSVVPSPNGTFGYPLHDVDGLAANDVWSVGNTGSSAGLDYDTVTLHWDGSAWAQVTSPNGNPSGFNDLDALAAASPGDVWAVGKYWGNDTLDRPLILHWNGTAWSIAANGCGTYGSLTGITVISPTDIWAVGSALTCHYDGASWTLVPSPQPRPQFNELAYSLLDVDAVSSSDIWAVGTRTVLFGESYVIEPLAEHWDGSAWTAFYGSGGGSGVTALASNDVWAAGLGAIVHWDGATWEVVPSPVVGSGAYPNDIDTAGVLWAAGSYYDASGAQRTLIEQAPSATQGTVTGATGVSGALVTWIGATSGTVETDSFGHYAVAGLPAGSYTFTASAPFCQPAVAAVTVVAGIVVVQDLMITC